VWSGHRIARFQRAPAVDCVFCDLYWRCRLSSRFMAREHEAGMSKPGPLVDQICALSPASPGQASEGGFGRSDPAGWIRCHVSLLPNNDMNTKPRTVSRSPSELSCMRAWYTEPSRGSRIVPPLYSNPCRRMPLIKVRPSTGWFLCRPSHCVPRHAAGSSPFFGNILTI
jgi:hypothetical protein